MAEYYIPYYIAILIVAIIMGCITKAINQNKGYDGGFAWGFWLGIIGIIVVAVRQSAYHSSYSAYRTPTESELRVSALALESHEKRLFQEGGWRCPRCNKVHAKYVSSCPCGFIPGKETVESTYTTPTVNTGEEIRKYKQLFDDGIISEEEFIAKKKQLLGI